MDMKPEVTPEVKDLIRKELLRQYADQLGVDLEVVSIKHRQPE